MGSRAGARWARGRVSLRLVRYIFISLVVVNLVLVAWLIFMSARWDIARVTDEGGEGSQWPNRLMLVSEREAGLVWEEFSPRTERCHTWGPYSDRRRAEQARLRLGRSDITGWAGRLETPGEGFDYMVYVAPAPSRELAMRALRELEAMGVDSHIVSEGELTGAVSLGIHALREEADRLSAQIAGWGYDVVMKDVPRSRVSYWVVGEARDDRPPRGPKPAESGVCMQFAEIIDFN